MRFDKQSNARRSLVESKLNRICKHRIKDGTSHPFSADYEVWGAYVRITFYRVGQKTGVTLFYGL